MARGVQMIASYADILWARHAIFLILRDEPKECLRRRLCRWHLLKTHIGHQTNFSLGGMFLQRSREKSKGIMVKFIVKALSSITKNSFRKHFFLVSQPLQNWLETSLDINVNRWGYSRQCYLIWCFLHRSWKDTVCSPRVTIQSTVPTVSEIVDTHTLHELSKW